MSTDNFKDLVALVSSDDGKSWMSRLRFDQISSIKSCVYATCRSSCDLLSGLTIFPAQVCDAMAKPTPAPAPGKGGGCSCGAAPGGPARGGGGGQGRISNRRKRRKEVCR